MLKKNHEFGSQATAAENVADKVDALLQFAATSYPVTKKVTYHANDMVLHTHSNKASYLGES
jgi:hypothetical protein